MASPSTSSTPVPPSNTTATHFLTSLLNKSLRIHLVDGRMFIGQLKCTDRERNVVLATTYEYRRPTARALERAAAAAQSGQGTVKLDMERRFVGLVVVPGESTARLRDTEPRYQHAGWWQ
ncbi:hypothetical protein ANO11243_064790 [Dothideomycetidae sp. 11243]|nr:hypothetical protein ANO11243_064790 [fungal sp. No.11243]